ncbi:MAG: preprotein translocase subunit SecY [Clostridia bacterium]|nr:preprotein translocase subunit SecY [Clostridia bacterium]
MFETIKKAWSVPETRKEILYTIMILLIYRLFAFIPIPGINSEVIRTQIESNSLLGFYDMMNGGALKNYTLMAMGITPYINASIIMNLLTVAIPSLERMAKEEDGPQKINKITSYVTLVLAFIQAVGILVPLGKDAVLDTGIFNYVTIGICLTAGTAISIWLGERITSNGIGNGVSLLIFVNVISVLPTSIINLVKDVLSGNQSWWLLILVAVGAVAIIAAVVYVDSGERRVSVQYAKRVVGRKMMGGQSQHIPIKVNSTGVLPIIFASVFLAFPTLVLSFWPSSRVAIFYGKWLGQGTIAYSVAYFVLILFFTYFYTMISFNPVDVSKNIQQYGGFIPGIRPGKPTSDYLARISNRLTLFGGAFLALIAAVPMLFTRLLNIQNAFGATSILILVSVALETTKQLESKLMMRHYKGFLK